MITTLAEARERLLAEGLLLSDQSNPSNTLVYGSFEDSGIGIQVSHDASGLFFIDNRWIAAFPSRGLQQYRVPGSLSELVDLIVSVYRHYWETGGEFWRSVEAVIPNVDQYLTGRQPAAV
jgi:hypothetical protein